MDISVVLTTYNQPYSTICASILSIIRQKDIRFELIISDDCSSSDYAASYSELFRKENFRNYTILRNRENKKTVLNIADALASAHAPLVKVVDAGDLLFDPQTLRKIVEFSYKNKISAGFGNIIRFRQMEDGSYVAQPFLAPKDPSTYIASSPDERKLLIQRKMESSDWIPAPAQFYRTDYYQKLLYELYDMGVRYCQDFTATLALADGRVSHLNEPIYWYEWGTGISTGGSLASRKKLYADHMRFYTEMSSRKPLGANLNKAVAFFRIKQFVALNTPIYSALTKLLDQSFNSASLETPNAFFFECMTARESNVSIR